MKLRHKVLPPADAQLVEFPACEQKLMRELQQKASCLTQQQGQQQNSSNNIKGNILQIVLLHTGTHKHPPTHTHTYACARTHNSRNFSISLCLFRFFSLLREEKHLSETTSICTRGVAEQVSKQHPAMHRLPGWSPGPVFPDLLYRVEGSSTRHLVTADSEISTWRGVGLHRCVRENRASF